MVKQLLCFSKDFCALEKQILKKEFSEIESFNVLTVNFQTILCSLFFFFFFFFFFFYLELKNKLLLIKTSQLIEKLREINPKDLNFHEYDKIKKTKTRVRVCCVTIQPCSLFLCPCENFQKTVK